MTFLDSLKTSLGYKIGIYNLMGELLEGMDIGFKFTSSSLIDNGKTFILCGNIIAAIDSELSKDACSLVKAAHSLFYSKQGPGKGSLEYIIKNNVPSDSIIGKYYNYNVLYIRSTDDVLDMIKNIYEDEFVEYVIEDDGVYLVKSFEDVKQEAEAIIEGIWHEKGLKVIIGCGRTIKGDYTVLDAARHAKISSKIAMSLNSMEGFFNIDKILIYGLINTLRNDDISFYLHGGQEGFILAARDKELVDTAEQLFKCNLNISEASRNLYIHRNTLLYRIEKIKSLTGLDIKVFEDALTFKFILTILRLKDIII